MSFPRFFCLVFVVNFIAGQSVELYSGENNYNHDYFIPRNRRDENNENYKAPLADLYRKVKIDLKLLNCTVEMAQNFVSTHEQGLGWKNMRTDAVKPQADGPPTVKFRNSGQRFRNVNAQQV